ncbi:hypothetical protein [Streptomyces mutabilis]|uniref:hypothetical protein n=1 Tax=Streptomyces mutabilis TaxID=67332 RepID=UPI0012B69319|nr:hypothetical protein [Streptomyces mutabilis]
MTSRQRTLTATVAVCAALGTRSACDSDPTGPRGTPAERATSGATAYVTGLANGSANPRTMCELETMNRPNFPDDGGALAGCITACQNAFRHRPPTTAPQPAGEEALVTVRKDSPAPWSCVERLTEEDGRWSVARLQQTNHAPTARAGHPVAQIGERAA